MSEIVDYAIFCVSCFMPLHLSKIKRRMTNTNTSLIRLVIDYSLKIRY